jgi:hypothetical protein
MPYREQGSALFDEPEIKEMRRAIRSSAKIRSASLQFWTASGLNAKQRMTFETYAYIHRRISKALAPELSDEEAQEAAAEEWLEDLDGDEPDEGLSFDRYAKGLFGIADMWTEKVDELEYVIFINKLYRRASTHLLARRPCPVHALLVSPPTHPCRLLSRGAPSPS